MSGHNKWSSIKHKKGAADAKRGKIFTKIVKEILVAAREGGGNPEMNPRLRMAIASAKAANMPNSNVDKAIKKGSGDMDGVSYDSYVYEGYGQGGVAIIVETLTDNKQRTVAEVRHCFSKFGGNMGETGAVGWMFDQKGLIEIKKDGNDEEELMMTALDCGADDLNTDEENFKVYTPYAELHNVMKALEAAGYTVEKAELTRLPQNLVNADDVAARLLKLLDKLEDLDDVQKVYSNCEISEEVMERLSED